MLSLSLLTKYPVATLAVIAALLLAAYIYVPRLFRRGGKREGFQAVAEQPPSVSPVVAFTTPPVGLNSSVPTNIIGNQAACTMIRSLLDPVNARIKEFESAGQITDELTLMKTTKKSLEDQLAQMQCS
jgi:hypothetical protein